MRDKCDACRGPTQIAYHSHKTEVGDFLVYTGGNALTCTKWGEYKLSLEQLAQYERETALLLLTFDKPVSGEAIKLARKALGLRREELAKILEVEDQQVYFWESQTQIDRSLRLAIYALFFKTSLSRNHGTSIIIKKGPDR